MDFSHYSDAPVQLAVDLVNTFNPVNDNDQLATPTDFMSVVGNRAREWDGEDMVATEDDMEAIRALRARLRSVFDAGEQTEAARILNDLLVDVGAVPRISVHGEGPHLHFESAGDDVVRRLGAITAMGLSTALIEGGFDRFGKCDSSTCDDVYVDTSRNRSRRNCSEKCTTRENVAAYRSRQNA
jgi:predicted RNA-binding Zn ribbon-like protein